MDHEETCDCKPCVEYEARVAAGRCGRCGNWPQICGHDLPFAERIKSVAVDTSGCRT